MLRVRFAPSPTGFLHVGSARTFIFNWLYARHNGGTMLLRLDDTDVDRNSQASVNSIFEGLAWLGLNWDEEYKQSERLAFHKQVAEAIFAKGMAYRDFTPAHAGDSDQSSGAQGAWLFNPGMRELSREESDRRAAAGEPFALRFRVPRGHDRLLRFTDSVYGEQSKLADEVEDFALLRSDGLPTYHLASCADDADLRISHIIRGQDHLSNTYKHLLIFEAIAGSSDSSAIPQFAHLPLLVAPDGTKLSKRKHGPVVSVTTYRDAGFLPEAFINFLCLLGWSPKNDREFLTLPELTSAFTLEGVNRANAVVNFKEDDPFDPKAIWLNAEHLRALPVERLAAELLPVLQQADFGHVVSDCAVSASATPESAGAASKAGWPTSAPQSGECGNGSCASGACGSGAVTPEKVLAVTALIRERIKLLKDAVSVADFFFVPQLASYDSAELIPPKGDATLARRILTEAQALLAGVEFDHASLEAAFRETAERLGVKAGPMFTPVRVAVCGRRNAPPLFETMEVLGRECCLERISQALARLQ